MKQKELFADFAVLVVCSLCFAFSFQIVDHVSGVTFLYVCLSSLAIRYNDVVSAGDVW